MIWSISYHPLLKPQVQETLLVLKTISDFCIILIEEIILNHSAMKVQVLYLQSILLLLSLHFSFTLVLYFCLKVESKLDPETLYKRTINIELLQLFFIMTHDQHFFRKLFLSFILPSFVSFSFHFFLRVYLSKQRCFSHFLHIDGKLGKPKKRSGFANIWRFYIQSVDCLSTKWDPEFWIWTFCKYVTVGASSCHDLINMHEHP